MEFDKNAFVKDFISRTKENIQYGNHPYEITQFVNSLIGLLVLPKEKYYHNIKNNMIDSELLNKIQQCVIINTPEKDLDLKYIIRRMRNAISHFHVDFTVDPNTREISGIIFSDYDPNNNKNRSNFKISLTPELIKTFIYQFSDAISKI